MDGRTRAGNEGMNAQEESAGGSSAVPDEAYTVGDLLNETELHLKYVAGDPERLTRPIVGAHAAEGVDLEQVLVPDWVLLTAGVDATSPAKQRALIEQLDTGG